MAIFGAVANLIFNGQSVEGMRPSLLEAGSGAVCVTVVIAGLVTLVAALAVRKTSVAESETKVEAGAG